MMMKFDRLITYSPIQYMKPAVHRRTLENIELCNKSERRIICHSLLMILKNDLLITAIDFYLYHLCRFEAGSAQADSWKYRAL